MTGGTKNPKRCTRLGVLVESIEADLSFRIGRLGALLPLETLSSCAEVRSCSEFASDLRDVAALKASARKFVL